MEGKVFVVIGLNQHNYPSHVAICPTEQGANAIAEIWAQNQGLVPYVRPAVMPTFE